MMGSNSSSALKGLGAVLILAERKHKPRVDYRLRTGPDGRKVIVQIVDGKELEL